MSSRSFSFTVTAFALLALIAVGLLLSPGDRNAGATNLREVKKLIASDVQSGQFFGRSVAVSGDTAASPDRALTAPVLLYDVDFGSPPHTVGLPPVTGAGAAPRDTVSRINFGKPTVVASFGPLTDQPLEFDSFDGQGDQIEFRLSNLPAQSSYTIEADLVIAAVDDYGWPFVVFIDAPDVRRIDFRADGTVTIGGPGGSVTFGSFTFGSEIHLRIEVDLAADSWQIFLNSVLFDVGGFGGATAIRTVRFTTGLGSPPGGASAAVDNIRISGPKPTATPTPCPTGKVPAEGGCGTATPTPTPDPLAGAMEVDCDVSAAGVQGDCTYSTGGTFSMQVHVTAPPEDGYFLFQAKIEWTDGVLNYLPTAEAEDEALWPQCTIAERANNWEAIGVPSVIIGCAPFPSLPVGDTFTGAVLTFEFQCKSAPLAALSPPAGMAPNQSVLDLISSVNEPHPSQGGTIFVGAGLRPIAPALTGATVTCAEPMPTPTDTPMPTLTPIPPTPHGSHSSVAGITLPQTGAGSAGSGGAGVLTWLAAGAAAAGAFSLGYVAWYARRRR